jgi:hypothetical protein
MALYTSPNGVLFCGTKQRRLNELFLLCSWVGKAEIFFPLPPSNPTWLEI